MNPLIFQALCGLGGIVAGLAILTVFYLLQDYFSRDARWRRRNAKLWQEQEKRRR